MQKHLVYLLNYSFKEMKLVAFAVDQVDEFGNHVEILHSIRWSAVSMSPGCFLSQGFVIG